MDGIKKFVFQIVLLVVVILASLYYYKGGGNIPSVPFAPQGEVTKTVLINDARIGVEIAETKEKRGKGLGGREKLEYGSGMLFIFEHLDRYPFWMKGLKFPLDFIWIKDETILDITENVQPPLPESSDESLHIYTSKEAINKVLEVNAGLVNDLNIKVGDKIRIE